VENFIGNTDAKVDNKGRVFVPAEFRKILQTVGDSRLILRKDIFENFLVLYPVPVWEEELSIFSSKIKKHKRKDRQAYQKFIQDANLLEMDASGRILIPKRYLQIAGISVDVRFIGVDQTIQIWDPYRSEHQEMDDAAFEEFMDQLDDDE
jgi:MraZ protein